MGEIEKTVAELVKAVDRGDNEAAKTAATGLAVVVMNDIHRIANALTLLANIELDKGDYLLADGKVRNSRTGRFLG